MPLTNICVYCGSSRGENPNYAQAAAELGKEIRHRGSALIYGGGSIGLMGVLADTVLELGGSVTGVITQELWEHEVGHRRLTKVHIVATMHERKHRMFEMSDGFVVMPGGFGTLDEFFEVITWLQLGIHRQPVGLLNIDGYYDPLLTFLEHACEEGFVTTENRRLILDAPGSAELLDAMEQWTDDRTNTISADRRQGSAQRDRE